MKNNLFLDSSFPFLTKNPNDPYFCPPPPRPSDGKPAVSTPFQLFEVNIKPCFQNGCKYREMSRTGSSEEDFSALSEQENAYTCTVETRGRKKERFRSVMVFLSQMTLIDLGFAQNA